jgi:SAM-dependent methyltransferase
VAGSRIAGIRPAEAPGPRRPPGPAAGAARRLDQVAPLAPNAWLRFDVVASMLPAAAVTALEIGCGGGSFGARLATRYDYLGLEPDLDCAAAARDRLRALGRGEVQNIAAEFLPDRQFDLVCAFEVLEHIENDRAALRAWARLVRPGGWLLLSVPAGPDRFGPWDELVGHFRRYEPSGLAGLLTETGFTRVRTRLYGFPLGYALEPARNAVARRRLARSAGQTINERTAASGRQLQPSAGPAGVLSHWATAPFQFLQRAFPGTGTGLVATARRPAQPG